MDKRSILRTIAAEAAHGKLSFPTSAEAALRIMRALEDPDCHLDAAARLVQAEPLLSARVVALANSTAYNASGREIGDVPQAVSRLGFRTLRALAAAVVTRQMAGLPADPRQRQLAAQLWEHTAHVAALAQLLASRVTRQDAESAMFAGLVHEIGGFYLISCGQDFPGLLDGDLSALGGDWAHDLSRTVLQALGVPAAVVDAVEVLGQGYLALPPVSLGDTLLLADELAPCPSPWLPVSPEQSADMSGNIEVLIGEETLSGILQASAAAVASLTGALRF